jgi:hypothetical protein
MQLSCCIVMPHLYRLQVFLYFIEVIRTTHRRSHLATHSSICASCLYISFIVLGNTINHCLLLINLWACRLHKEVVLYDLGLIKITTIFATSLLFIHKGHIVLSRR